eukprot:126260-Rhodomonas_salina.4
MLVELPQRLLRALGVQQSISRPTRLEVSPRSVSRRRHPLLSLAAALASHRKLLRPATLRAGVLRGPVRCQGSVRFAIVEHSRSFGSQRRLERLATGRLRRAHGSVVPPLAELGPGGSIRGESNRAVHVLWHETIHAEELLTEDSARFELQTSRGEKNQIQATHRDRLTAGAVLDDQNASEHNSSCYSADSAP